MAQKIEDLAKGDQLYVVRRWNELGNGGHSYEITKIGRDYIYAGGHKFRKPDLTDDNHLAYLSEEHYLQKKKMASLRNKVRRAFEFGSRDKITDEQILKVAEILGIKVD